MRLVSICLVLSASLIIVLGQNVDYKGFKVYNVKFERKNQQDRFHQLKSDVVDYWRKPSLQRGIVGQAMVPPSHFDWFETQLEELGVERDVAIEDVYSFITENSKTNAAITSRNENEEFSFEGYYRFNEILNHINRLKEAYSNSTTISLDVVEAGRTEENRALVYIKLTSNNIVTTPKPIAIIEAGINPREWVTIPSALYVINKLLEEENVSLLDDFEWIVIPVLNPDGYEYSHTNLRLWTKNRSTRSNLGFICPGANLNRNFDIDWSASDSSSTPCSHIFAGVSPFSEEETQFLRSIFEEFGPKIGLYFSLQHTGGFISYPWQYEKAASGMFRQHLLLSRDMVAAMNETYDSGVGSLMHGERASGTSIDYARDKEVLYTFNVDIIPIGNSGVMVPESEIVSVAEDVWRAVYVAGNGFKKYR